MTVPLRNAVIGVVVAALLATGTIWLLIRDTDPGTEVRPGQTDASPPDSAELEIPSFRFDVGDRELVPSARGHVSRRDRRTARQAADRVQSVVTDLYVGAFLDPGHWTAGTYDEVFEIFAGSAREEARRRVGVLTAGEGAGDRFDGIEPIDGRLALRILLDRGGKPIVVAGKVRFRARGSGAEPTLIRSDGTYLFRRIEGAWRIVSFDVERSDRKEGGT
jgi:hypothetical protein